jgi:hypothetical protein
MMMDLARAAFIFAIFTKDPVSFHGSKSISSEAMSIGSRAATLGLNYVRIGVRI